MKVTADTNVLVRAVVGDDPQQSAAAQSALAAADLIAVPTPVLCEFVWVLAQGYKIAPAEISEAVRALIDSANVVADRPAVEAGLDILEAGGDFADGAIAFEGRWLGGESFLSFDRKATALLKRRGIKVSLLT